MWHNPWIRRRIATKSGGKPQHAKTMKRARTREFQKLRFLTSLLLLVHLQTLTSSSPVSQPVPEAPSLSNICVLLITSTSCGFFWSSTSNHSRFSFPVLRIPCPLRTFHAFSAMSLLATAIAQSAWAALSVANSAVSFYQSSVTEKATSSSQNIDDCDEKPHSASSSTPSCPWPRVQVLLGCSSTFIRIWI